MALSYFYKISKIDCKQTETYLLVTFPTVKIASKERGLLL